MKCTTVCQQQGHAEVQALRLAGAKARGATAVITGHTYACRECQEALFSAGVLFIGVRNEAQA
jgi:pyrimidine deaminase RibD-like protein